MRRVLAPVLLLVLALALSACGGDTVALNPVANAAVQTQSAAGMRMTMSGSFEGGGLEGSFTARGVFDSEMNSGRTTMTLAGGPGAGQTIEMIQDGMVGYMRGSAFERVLPVGKHWVKIDAEKFAKSFGISFQELTAASPNQALEQLQEASKSVEEVGSARVRGVMTTHYRAMLDPAKLKLPEKLAEMTAPEYGPIDVWIDGEQMVRRMTVSASSLVSGARVQMSFTMEFYDFGVKVDVQPPPEDEVVDVSELG